MNESHSPDIHLKFSELDEEVRLSLTIEYYKLLKKRSDIREMLLDLIPDASALYDRIVGHPFTRQEIPAYFVETYRSCLQDLKYGLMSYDDTLDIVDNIYQALSILNEAESSNSRVNNDGHRLNTHMEQKNPVEKEPQEDKDEATSIVLTRELIESARTPNGGFTKSQLAAIGISWPRPTDWIEQVIGKRITSKQLEDFRRIEYVAPANSPTSKSKSDEHPISSQDTLERQRMNAIIRVIRQKQRPMTPIEIACEVTWDDWGGSIVRPKDVEELLRKMPEVDSAMYGKYSIHREEPKRETIINKNKIEVEQDSLHSTKKPSKRWTLKEERDLENFYAVGMTIHQIALFFDQEDDSIKEKLKQKGLIK